MFCIWRVGLAGASRFPSSRTHTYKRTRRLANIFFSPLLKLSNSWTGINTDIFKRIPNIMGLVSGFWHSQTLVEKSVTCEILTRCKYGVFDIRSWILRHFLWILLSRYVNLLKIVPIVSTGPFYEKQNSVVGCVERCKKISKIYVRNNTKVFGVKCGKNGVN